MKNKYLLKPGKTLWGIAASLALGLSANAQVQNNQNIYVADYGVFSMTQDNFAFGASPALTQTTKSGANYGVIAFGQNATWSGASDSHYLNGYARYYGNSFFLAPVGDSGTYAPAGINPAGTSGVDVAYFKTNPSALGTTLDTGISALSGVEYWKVSGATNATITLTWRASSNISGLMLTPSLTYITILGYDGTKWVEIPSFYDATSILGGTSDTTSGSITSTAEVNLSAYQAFTIGAKGEASCYPLVASSGNTKTWNGSSWSPSAPTISDPVVINGDYSAGSFRCYSLALNANITLTNGQTLDVVDAFTGSGKIIMSSEASVLQRNATAAPPKIELTKVTNPMRRFDYAFFSSPLNNFGTFFGQITSAANTAVNGNYNTYPASAFYNYFTDNDAGNSVTVTASNVAVGRGFAATVRAVQGPYSTAATAGSWFTEKYPIHIKAEGTTNNGDINVPMPTAVGWVRIGNPYPSPINANKLLDALGDDIRKTIYYWTFNTPRQNWANNTANYNNADYATFNYSGGVAACPTCQEPNGMIATMQSVYVRKLNPNPITFTMTNCLRDLDGNNVFFREASQLQGKFKLNLTGSSGSFSQILVAYNNSTTNGYDNGYDSPRMSGANTSEINSLISGQTTGYAIQTRQAFSDTDAVPLQLIKRLDETFIIALADTQGIFNSGGITIYLHDKHLGLFHDLATGSYSFVQSATPDNDRFEIVYRASTLDNPDLEAQHALAFINNQVFSAQSKNAMAQISIYDLTGRLIETFSNVNSNLFTAPFIHAQSVYIAKIQLEDGSIVNQKVINNK